MTTPGREEELTHFAGKQDSNEEAPENPENPDDPNGRTICWATFIIMLVLALTGSILGGFYGYKMLDESKVHVNPTTSFLGLLISMLVWPFLVFPFTLISVGLPYFFGYWPGFLLLYLNVLLGTAGTAGFFRWLSHRSHWVSRFTLCLKGKAQYVIGLRRVFKERTATLSALGVWGPLPIPLMVALVALLTEADYPTFVFWCTLSSWAMVTPVAILAASAGDIKDAFSSDNPGTIAVTIVGLVFFVVLMIVMAYYTRSQLDAIAGQAESGENAIATGIKFGESPTYLSMSADEPPDAIEDGFSGENCSHPAI